MNFFERELRTLFKDGQTFDAPSFVGRACLGTLGKDLRVRVEFDTNGIVDHYGTLKISVLNRTGGSVDTLAIGLKELLGMKAVPAIPISATAWSRTSGRTEVRRSGMPSTPHWRTIRPCGRRWDSTWTTSGTDRWSESPAAPN